MMGERIELINYLREKLPFYVHETIPYWEIPIERKLPTRKIFM